MYLTGKETKSDLKNKCSCGTCTHESITMDGSCLVAHLQDECSSKSLCLGGLDIPISCAVEATKTVPAGGYATFGDCFCKDKFIGILVKDNKSVYYRMLDDLSDNLNTINYDFNINISTTEIIENKVEVTVEVQLTPDNTNYVASWDGIGNIYINGEPFSIWSDADLSWFDVGTANISNNLVLPSITGTIIGQMHNDGNGNLPTKIISGNISNGVINYYIELELAYDYDTTTFSYDIIKIELQLGEFLDDNIAIQMVDQPATFATGGFNIVGSGFADIGFQTGNSFDINGEVFTEGAEFNIGLSDSLTAQSLIDAINANTNLNTLIIATHDYVVGNNGGGTIILTTLTAGAAGNLITTEVLIGNHNAIDTTLTGGSDLDPATTIDITDDIVNISMEGKFKTISAKRFKSINPLLILSSMDTMKLDDIEFYNNGGTDTKICLLTAG